MRRTIPSGVHHAFCNICGRSQCNGYGDGASIPDHSPDMDSTEEPGTITVTCNICGKDVTHDFKGDPECGPTWRQVVDAWFEGPDDIGSNHQNDDDVDFCETCWNTKIKPLFQVPAWGNMDETLPNPKDNDVYQQSLALRKEGTTTREAILKHWCTACMKFLTCSPYTSPPKPAFENQCGGITWQLDPSLKVKEREQK